MVSFKYFFIPTALAMSLGHLKGFSHSRELADMNSLRSKVQNELGLSSSPQNWNTSSGEMFVIPQELLSSTIYEDLGWGFLMEGLYLLRVMKKVISLPKKFETLFLFKSSNTDDKDTNSKSPSLPEIIASNLPFTLPAYMNLVNYYLVLPKSYIREHTNGNVINLKSPFSQAIASAKLVDLPLSSPMIGEKPILIFKFSDSTLESFKKLKTPIVNFKQFLRYKTTVLSSFFDSLAKNWISDIDYNSLLSSSFCTSSTTSNYCLKIANNSVTVYPEQHLLKRDEIESQAIRQIHDKLSNYADKFNDVSYEAATEPKQLIETVDERLDEKRYRLYDNIDEKKDRIVDKKDSLVEKTAGVVDMVKNKLGFINNLKSDDYDTGESSYNVKEDSLMKRDGVVIPLSLILGEEPSSPRNPHFSQVLYEDSQEEDGFLNLNKRFSIFSPDKDCECISWYNVFHHSIFGNPRFCLY